FVVIVIQRRSHAYPLPKRVGQITANDLVVCVVTRLVICISAHHAVVACVTHTHDQMWSETTIDAYALVNAVRIGICLFMIDQADIMIMINRTMQIDVYFQRLYGCSIGSPTPDAIVTADVLRPGELPPGTQQYVGRNKCIGRSDKGGINNPVIGKVGVHIDRKVTARLTLNAVKP